MRPIPPTCARQPDPLYPPFRGRALPPGAIPSLSLAAPLHYYLATSSFLWRATFPRYGKYFWPFSTLWKTFFHSVEQPSAEPKSGPCRTRGAPCEP